MNLIQYFVQTKDKCILTDSLFYGTIKYSESSGELKCENAFFVLLVTSGKAKIHIEKHMITRMVSEKMICSLSGIHDRKIQTIERGLCEHCLVLTPPFFHSLPSSQFLYGKLCEFVTKHSFASIHLKNVAGNYFRRVFTLFQGYTADTLLHHEGIYGHLCNFLLLNVGDIFFASIADASPALSNKTWICHRFKDLMFEHYRRQHKINFYAERLSVFGYYLSRIVKEETGQTIREHITRLLYAEAKKMLSCSKMTFRK